MRVCGRRRGRFRLLVLLALGFIAACSSVRLYYIESELRTLENRPDLRIVPGPWKNENVPIVIEDRADVPDDLVIPLLRELTRLPGAMDACDPNTGRPRPDATEYCVATYRTPKDWRASWPVRSLMGETNSCPPPFGGVEDEDFGGDLPIFGFAHNHPCGTNMSSPDMLVFPKLKVGEGAWRMVAYAASPSGRLPLDSRGQPVPAWTWLATGRANNIRFYKWDHTGNVFRWNEGSKKWEFQAICVPQPGSSDLRPIRAKCTPELQ